MASLGTVHPPEGGIWRIARGPDPLAHREPPPTLDPGGGPTRAIGHRFDSAQGNYSVLYFGTKLECCYGETLACFRPSPTITRDRFDEDGFMNYGEIPADWRDRRIAVRCTLPGGLPFLDVEDMGTRTHLDKQLPWLLAIVGLDGIDVSAIRGKDRRLTRWISQWAHAQEAGGEPQFGGVRFCSRINTDWELWAVFDRTRLHPVENVPILPQDDALRRVAKHFELQVF